MADKILKTRKQFSSTLRTDLLEQLQEHSSNTDIPISKLLDRAVEAYLLQKSVEDVNNAIRNFVQNHDVIKKEPSE